MAWQQLHIDCDADDPDRIEACLQEAGALALTVTDAADEAVLEPLPGEIPKFAHAMLSALFNADVDRARVERALMALLGTQGEKRLRWQQVDDRNWERVWLERFGARRFGERLWVAPHGDTVDSDALVVRLDPGLAFGTGDHETTALCLEWLDRTPLSGKTLLDYGCGSGILALAAARLGAGRVTAIDYDPQAITATYDNAVRNGLSDRIEVAQDTAPPPGPFDVVIANILAGVLVELAGSLARCVATEGSIVLSGILYTQTGEVMDAYRRWVDWQSPQRRGDWALICGRRTH